jgi:hypothetical protein
MPLPPNKYFLNTPNNSNLSPTKLIYELKYNFGKKPKRKVP